MKKSKTHTQVALNHLSNSNTYMYQKVPRMSAKTVKVKSIWKNICLQNKSLLLSRKVLLPQTPMCPDSTISLRATKLAQILKYNPSYQLNINGPNQCISWLLTNDLKPMLENAPAHQQNSLQLIKCIEADNLTTNKTLPYPCSLDVVSLYTSISIQEAITNAADRIQNPILHQTRNNRSSHSHAKQHLLLSRSSLLPKEGLPMGSSISDILAILFMDKLETLALSSHLLISPFRGYVDDIYLQTTSEEMADQFHHTMNNPHPQIEL